MSTDVTYSQIDHRYHVNGYTSIDDWAELVETFDTKADALQLAAYLVKKKGGYRRCTVSDTMALRGAPAQWIFDREDSQ